MMSALIGNDLLSVALLAAALILILLRLMDFLNPWRTWDRWWSLLYNTWLICEANPAGQATSFIERLTLRAITTIWGNQGNIVRLIFLSLLSTIAVYLVIFVSVYIGYKQIWNEIERDYDALQEKYLQDRNLMVSDDIEFFQAGFDSDEHQARFIEISVNQMDISVNEATENYQSLLQYTKESMQIFIDFVYPDEYREAIRRSQARSIQSIVVFGVSYFLSMWICFMISVAITIFLIRFHLYVSAKYKSFRVMFFIVAISMDAVAAIVFTSIAITISVPIVQYFTEVANSDSVCGS